MPTLNDLVNKRREVAVQWGDMAVHVTYRPYCDSMRAGVDGELTLYKELELLLIAWDITEDSGEMAPINAETFNRLPNALLKAIDVAIGRDQYQKVAER